MRCTFWKSVFSWEIIPWLFGARRKMITNYPNDFQLSTNYMLQLDQLPLIIPTPNITTTPHTTPRDQIRSPHITSHHIRSEQIRSDLRPDQRPDQIREEERREEKGASQINSDQLRSDHIRSGHTRSYQIRSDMI